MDSKKEQFSLIYDQYIEKIYRFVYLKVDRQEKAEDLTSKVFLKGWEAYRGQDITNPGAFLYQIARNTVIDHYRQKEKNQTFSIDRVAEPAGGGASAYEKAVMTADLEAIKVAIKNLNKDYQDVIIWYYLEDMSAPQIAELIGKPAGTVRVMIHRGLEMLKNELHQES